MFSKSLEEKNNVLVFLPGQWLHGRLGAACQTSFPLNETQTRTLISFQSHSNLYFPLILYENLMFCINISSRKFRYKCFSLTILYQICNVLSEQEWIDRWIEFFQLFCYIKKSGKYKYHNSQCLLAVLEKVQLLSAEKFHGLLNKNIHFLK